MTTANADTSTAWVPPLSELGQFVHGRVLRLQQGYLANRSTETAQLARLRRAIGSAPGSVPEVWDVTLQGLDLPSNVDDAPTPREYAAYTAVTLYALHQQSRRVKVHRRGDSLGTATRRLVRSGVSEEAMTRRFQAIGTAVEFSEIVFHARGLISQLRGSGDRSTIQLDYGLFADHLLKLQLPSSAGEVRLRWGRDFYRPAAASEAASPSDSKSEALDSFEPDSLETENE